MSLRARYLLSALSALLLLSAAPLQAQVTSDPASGVETSDVASTDAWVNGSWAYTAFAEDNIVWGTAVFQPGACQALTDRDENIVWGTRVVWGAADGWESTAGSRCGALIEEAAESQLQADENIVWGTARRWDDNIVWGTRLFDAP